MIRVRGYQDARVVVLGLGVSGLATARALAAGGADVVTWDDSHEMRQRAADQGLVVRDPATIDWQAVAALVPSPGVPRTHPTPHPVIAAACAAGVDVLGDVELLARSMRNAGFVGVTGTNGKSTTTALLAHILDDAGLQIGVGGNLGVPALQLAPVRIGGYYVLELSSYQLDLIDLIELDVAVLLNISPDHLDRHGGMDGYVSAKRKIFGHQDTGDIAIVGVDDAYSRAVYDDLVGLGRQRVVPISATRAVDGGVYVIDGILFDARGERVRSVADLTRHGALPGRHNWQNAAAAYAAARALDVPADRIVKLIGSFAGLAHRQEAVAAINGIRYVNDSKATNVVAAAQALGCYENIYWIAGGQAKDEPFDQLRPHLDRVVQAFLIGESAPHFAARLAGDVATTISGDLATAVAQATACAQAQGESNAVILLSPACASFDQFKNFEARGDAFRDLVKALPRRAPSKAKQAIGRGLTRIAV